MNTKLLEQVKQMILKRPMQFVMHSVFYDETEFENPASHCGTAACIAGWTITIANKCKTTKEARYKCRCYPLSEAADFLGIHLDQADRLFMEDLWPDKFKSCNARNEKEFSRLAAKRIDYFIKTKGQE